LPVLNPLVEFSPIRAFFFWTHISTGRGGGFHLHLSFQRLTSSGPFPYPLFFSPYCLYIRISALFFRRNAVAPFPNPFPPPGFIFFFKTVLPGYSPFIFLRTSGPGSLDFQLPPPLQPLDYCCANDYSVKSHFFLSSPHPESIGSFWAFSGSCPPGLDALPQTIAAPALDPRRPSSLFPSCFFLLLARQFFFILALQRCPCSGYVLPSFFS